MVMLSQHSFMFAVARSYDVMPIFPFNDFIQAHENTVLFISVFIYIYIHIMPIMGFDIYLNPLTAKLFNRNFHPLQVVSR